MDNFSTRMELTQPHGPLPRVSRPLQPISCTFLILITWIFITLPVSSLSPSYLWRFKIRETYKPGSADITHHVGSGDCPLWGVVGLSPSCLHLSPLYLVLWGCASTSLISASSLIKPNHIVKKGAKWSEEYGGCPYQSCRKLWNSEKHPTDGTVGAHYNDSGFFLYIPIPGTSIGRMGSESPLTTQVLVHDPQDPSLYLGNGLAPNHR
jgi:hypothetical protein